MDPTTQYKQCPQCKQLAALNAPHCVQCGRVFRTQFAPPPVDDQTRFFGGPPPATPSGPATPPPPQYPQQAYGPPPQPYQGHPSYPPQYPPQYPPPGYRTDIIQKYPGTHNTTAAILLAVLIGGWAAAFYNGQTAKGAVLLVGSVVLIGLFGLLTGFLVAIIIWGVGMADGIMVANRINRGEPVGQWQFF